MAEAAVDYSNEEVSEQIETPIDWKETAGLKGNPQFDKFESVEDLAKSYSELESYRGNSIRIPSSEAGEEQMQEFTDKLLNVPGVMRIPAEDDTSAWDNVYQQLGRPSAPDGYKLSEIEGFAGDPEAEGAFRQLAHESGLTAAQADAIHSWLGTNIAETEKQAAIANEEAMGRLKGEWGQAFDHKVQQATNAARMMADKVPGISEYFDSMAEKGYDASMIRLMDFVAGLMGESGAVPPASSNAITPSEAKEKLNDIRNNPDHPANNELDPGHEDARKQVIALYKAAYQ